MIIDFSNVDMNFIEEPQILLKNAEDEVIQPLGYAFNLEMDISYNEVSTIKFDLPAYVNGEKTPHYDEVVGMKYIDIVGYGVFVLVDPSVSKDGIEEMKSCKAYSIEYELTYKKISIEEDVYNFYNPLGGEETIISIINNYLPSWSIGTVDVALVGKYRNFTEENVNLYNLIKGSLQKTFNCIFDFDTYKRTINVKSVTSTTNTNPIYLSLDNLIKTININEDTENIFTCLDVNGAEGVDIRSVNPTGVNKIYNLDYFIDNGSIGETLGKKWKSYESLIESQRQSYYTLVVNLSLKNTAILTEKSYLDELKTGGNEDDLGLASLENLQSVKIDLMSSFIDKTTKHYEDLQKELNEINSKISAKKKEIVTQEKVVSDLEKEKDSIVSSMVVINKRVSYEDYFTTNEKLILDRYIKEESIEDSSFVLRNVDNYSDDNVSFSSSGTSVFSFKSGKTTFTPYADKNIYTFRSGILSSNSFSKLFNSIVISGTLETNFSDKSFVMTGYLSTGSIGGQTYSKGCVCITGKYTSANTDATSDVLEGEGTYLNLSASFSKVYFTKNATEYERQTVCYDLLEYGYECLDKLSQPTYTFKVSVANFFALSDFETFKNSLTLGEKVYLNLEEDEVLEPVFIGFKINFEKLNSLSLTFSDSYSSRDSSFSLADLLDQSISMGKTVDSSKYDFNSFVSSGASNAVKEFMESALDVSKTMILNATNQSITWDESGLKLRRASVDNYGNLTGDFEPEQLFMINNHIAFTDDGWNSVKMAIGKFEDMYLDDSVGEVYGIVAPYLVGTVMAAQNLLITNDNKSFKVDGAGMFAYNMTLVLEHEDDGAIVISPQYGLGAGTSAMFSLDKETNWGDYNTVKFNFIDSNGDIILKTGEYIPENVNFFLDARTGNAYFRGNVYAEDGVFNGTVYAHDGEFTGTVNAKKGYFENLAYGTLLGQLIGSGDAQLIGSELFIGVKNSYSNQDASWDNKTHNFMVNKYGEVMMTGSITIESNDLILKSKDNDCTIDLDGNIDMSGDINLDGNINLTGTISFDWTEDNTPVHYQYSATDTANTGSDTFDPDVHLYRRDSTDDKQTWTDWYRYPMPEYVTNYGIDYTRIDANGVESPTIRANTVYLYPETVYTSDFIKDYETLGQFSTFGIYGYIDGYTNSYYKANANDIKVSTMVGTTQVDRYISPYFNIALSDYNASTSFLPLVTIGSASGCAARFQFEYCSFPNMGIFYDTALMTYGCNLRVEWGNKILFNRNDTSRDLTDRSITASKDTSGNTYEDTYITVLDDGSLDFANVPVKNLYLTFA